VFINPKIKSSIDVHDLYGQHLFFLDEYKSLIFNGSAYGQLVPLLDGRHSLVDISKALTGKLTLPQIYFYLNELHKRGLLVEAHGAEAGEESAFFESFDASAAAVDARRQAFSVSARAVGGCSTADLEVALRTAGLTVGRSGDFLAVLTDDYLRPELAEINREMVEKKRPWMLIKPVGMVPWIGPIFHPGETGCWACLAQRLRMNRQMERYIRDRTGREGPVITSLSEFPAARELACDLAALGILKWLISSDASRLMGRLVSLDLFWRKSQEHVLVRRPQCAVCGETAGVALDGPVPVVLQERRKMFREDGGHRTLTPSQTFARYEHHISPILGAVSELFPTLGNKSELTPSYVAGHNFSMGLDSIVFLKESLRGVSGGKGSTDIQAKVSGLCEAIERYSGIFNGDEYAVRGTYNDLRPKAIHPNMCMGFSENQYRCREALNAASANSRYVLIPEPFDPDLPLDWTPVWSLNSNQFYYLPSAYCYYDHPDFRRRRWCFPDSNGTAAGNTLEEAILQGFMELIERDAVALWWYNRVRRRELDLDSFEMPYVKAIRAHYASLNRELWVLDITSDFEISTFVGVSRCTDRPVENIIIGFGAHFDPKIALLRAITEVNQFLPSVSLLHRDGSTNYLFGDQLARLWWTTATIEQNAFLKPLPGEPPLRFRDIRDHSSDDLLTDIRICTEMTREHGMDLLVLDQTRPDIGLNVVKVIVPQLCHFWRRLGKERLYDLPVKMGWLPRRLTEGELNPFSVFF